MYRRWIPLLALATIHCATAPAPLVQTVRGPASVETASGATLAIPAGLSATSRGDIVRLIDPDDAVDVFLVEIEGAKDELPASIEAAWRRVESEAVPVVDETTTPPSSDGWDAVVIQQYVKDADGRMAQAIARQKGPNAYVTLLRGAPGDLEKRAAQIRSFIGSLKVEGLREEDLSQRAATPIAASLAELESFIEAALAATDVPGFQIAIVEGDEIVFAKGYGVRAVGKADPVDADTLMMIGSVSKSMTTMMMASLVDDGVLAWDAKVVDVYPSFRLGDPALRDALLVEQLVCACTGLPRKDLPLILEYENKSAEDVFAELATFEPTTGLKETFQYQNHLVAAGGYIAAQLAKPDAPLAEAYADSMKARIFTPIGMTRTTLDLDRAIADPNHATPHSLNAEAKHEPVSFDHERFATYVQPSGGIWSTANEMAKVALTEIHRGVAPSGERVASEKNVVHRWAPQVAIADGVHYGLGFVTSEKHGLRTISHGGGTMGFATKLAFMPDKKVGVVMISNGTGGHMVEGLVESRLRELWFGVDEKSADRLKFAAKNQAEQFAKLASETKPLDAAWATPFLGVHTNPEIGTLTLEAKGGEYWMDAGNYRTRLLAYVGADGERTLFFADPPLMGIMLVPVDAEKGTFEMRRGQERYPFEKARP